MAHVTTRASVDEVSQALDRAGLGAAIQIEGAKYMVGLLRRLSLGRPVTLDEARELSAQFADGDELVDAVLLRSERDADGAIMGFLGLSLNEHPHHIRFGERRLRAWCAWDTLFLPPIVRETAIVTSRDPSNHRAITMKVSPSGVADASPEHAVLSVVTPDLRGCSDAANVQALFCQFVHFFSDGASAEQWFADKGVPAFLLTLDQGFELGRIRLAELVTASTV